MNKKKGVLPLYKKCRKGSKSYKSEIENLLNSSLNQEIEYNMNIQKNQINGITLTNEQIDTMLKSDSVIELEQSYTNRNPNNLSFKLKKHTYKYCDVNEMKPATELNTNQFDISNYAELMKTFPKMLEEYGETYERLRNENKRLTEKYNTQLKIIEELDKQRDKLVIANNKSLNEIKRLEKESINFKITQEELKSYKSESILHHEKVITSLKVRESKFEELMLENTALTKENITLKFAKEGAIQELNTYKSKEKRYHSEKGIINKQIEELCKWISEIRKTTTSPFVNSLIKENEEIKLERNRLQIENHSKNGIIDKLQINVYEIKRKMENICLIENKIRTYTAEKSEEIVKLVRDNLNIKNKIRIFYANYEKAEKAIKEYLSKVERIIKGYDPLELPKKAHKLLLNQKRQYEEKINQYENKIQDLIDKSEEHNIWNVL